MRIESEEGRGTTVTVSIPQQVAEENPEKPLINNKNLCVACFLMTEKYKVPQVREYYNKMIAHMVKQFDILLHRVTNRDELEQLLEVTPVTHLFVGAPLANQNVAGQNELTVCTLGAQTLCCGIAAVLGAAYALFMCHCNLPP